MAFASIGIAALLVGCKSPLPHATVDSQTVSALGSDTIRITISGDVQKPGIYRLPASVSLAELPGIAGGWTGHGEFGLPPHQAIVTNSESPDAKPKVYSLKKLSIEKGQAIHFRNGDAVTFPKVFF